MFRRAWLLRLALAIAMAHGQTTEKEVLKKGLLQRQQDYLQLTTQWHIRIKQFPDPKVLQHNPKELLQERIQQVEASLKEHVRSGKISEKEMQTLLERYRETIRKEIEYASQITEIQTLLTIEGHRSFWVVYGKVCAQVLMEGGELGCKEVYLPGSYVLRSPNIVVDSSKAQQQVATQRVNTVLPEADSMLLAMPPSPLLYRILLLGETPFHWAPEEFIRVEKRGSVYRLHSRYWYHDSNRVKEQWPVVHEVPDDPVQRQIAKLGLKVSFLVDPSKGFAITRFEGIQGQETVKITRWMRYGTLWLPAQIAIQQFQYEVEGGQIVRREGDLPALVGGKISRRLVSEITIHLQSVSWTRNFLDLQDVLPPNRYVTDYRLGHQPSRPVSYQFNGRFPNLKELETLYKEQQQSQPPNIATRTIPNWSWVFPAILVAVGLIWYLRSRLNNKGG